MDDYSVNLLTTGLMEDYKSALDRYYSEIIENKTTDLSITKYNLEKYIKALLDTLKSKDILFKPRKLEDNDRFRAEDYNNSFREILVDLMRAYEKIKTIETTANNIISIIKFIRNNILENMERQFVKLKVLQQLIDKNIQFDDIYVFENRTNYYPDKETAADVVNNTITLGKIDENILSFDTLYNNIELFTFNKNIDVRSSIYKSDETILMNIFGKSTTNTNTIDKPLMNKFLLSESDLNTGMTIGIIIDLSKPTLVNRIRLRSLSPFRINVKKIGFTQEYVSDVYNMVPSFINFESNEFNIDDIDIILPSSISARMLILVVQQPTGEIIPEPEYTIDYESYIDKVLDATNNYSSISVNINNNNISRKLRRKLESIIGYISHILGLASKTDVNLYQIMISGLDVMYTHYNDASIFMSDEYKSNRKINSVSIYDTTLDSNIHNTGVVRQFSIKVGPDDEFPIMPINADTYTHVIIIKDKETTDYKLPFICDRTKPITVTKNSLLFNEYETIDISDTQSTGIRLTGTFHVNDIITVEYTPSTTNILGKQIDPKSINIDKLFRPNLKNKATIQNRYVNKILVKHTDGTYVPYRIGTECYEAKLSFPDGEYFGYVINNPKRTDNLPEHVELSDTAIGIKEDDIIGPARTIYYGVFNETITLDNDLTSDTVYTTKQPYVPSSLFVFRKNDLSLINYDEYTDFQTQDKFTIKASPEYPVEKGDLLVSYTPISYASGESNIADYNMLEERQNTVNRQIELSNVPYIDSSIIKGLTETPQAWQEGDGIWFLKYNNTVVYKPLDVTVDGIPAVDKTQYTSTHKPTLNEFDPEIRNYEFVLVGKKIHFNTDISETPIAIKYYSNNDSVRLICRLYRLNRNVDDITPVGDYVALLVNTS